MIIHYGYADGRGEFYITIDTDKCNGCGKCVDACPQDVFEMVADDYGRVVVKVKDDVARSIGYVCPGYNYCIICHQICDRDAISHSW